MWTLKEVSLLKDSKVNMYMYNVLGVTYCSVCVHVCVCAQLAFFTNMGGRPISMKFSYKFTPNIISLRISRKFSHSCVCSSLSQQFVAKCSTASS